MPRVFAVLVSTNYPHRFTEEPPTAFYDREGYIIGAISDIKEIETDAG